ncbi:Mitochondrial import inner membrane translocase subunit TIM22-3 [Porphyridium purpureum]|uniref:Mitochondrial import inner membrane translocase subunit TIM22 n=1 Tax=Porphyridium purpureum TaxID=35688 RepID=A0A5J4YNE8_PORPP|nr:Mitochondrial import inner membrane translocase subunit TIM22-3 [Porphyridium purpureum]|eukprot:POR1182..scf295_9
MTPNRKLVCGVQRHAAMGLAFQSPLDVRHARAAKPKSTASDGSGKVSATAASTEAAESLASRSIQVRILDTAQAGLTSFVNGGLFGAIFGFVSGLASKRNLKLALGEARSSGISWGGIGALYAGIQTAAKNIRGVDDTWNTVLGACGSGVYLSWGQGGRSMAQGCVSFAAFTYVVEKYLYPRNQQEPLTDEEKLMYGK